MALSCRLSSVLQCLMLYEVTNLVLTKAAPVTDDAWGEWSAWSPCTRTCGPAISTQERSCLAETCKGPSKQFRSCPNEACGETLDLRRELCATYNESELSYSPIDGEDHCLLTCKATRPNGTMHVVGPVEAWEGTLCTTAHGDMGICVDTVCTAVGCDGLLGSKKKIDPCGQCVGLWEDDWVCKPTFQRVTSEQPQIGHVEVVVVPAGASSITVTNPLPPQEASLMVRSSAGEFLFTVGPPGFKFLAAEVEFTYNVAVSGENYTESLSGHGTLNESITIELYIPSRGVIPEIIYEYYTLEDNSVWGRAGTQQPLVSTTSSYDWMYGHFEQCTETCATGVEAAYAICRDLGNNNPLQDNYCSTPKPSPIVRRCGVEDCTPRWINRDWSSCSETQCGIGYQYTVAECHVMQANGRDQKVSDELCANLTRPDNGRECVRIDSSSCNTVWEVERWEECCSRESQERRIVCTDSLGNLQPPFLCSHIPRESSFKTCDTSPCTNDGCTWVAKRWFSCNNSCGLGIQTRTVKCRKNGKLVNDTCCKDQPMPEQLQECYDDRKRSCQPQWYPGSWNEPHFCTGSCGENRTRTVECQAQKGRVYITFPDYFCENQTRPIDSEPCTREDTTGWEVGPWSECYCPLGVKLRPVVCRGGNDECCLEREPNPPPRESTCDCHVDPSPTSVPTPTALPCVDNPAVNCTQIAAHCQDSTDFFKELLCCQTCSGLL